LVAPYVLKPIPKKGVKKEDLKQKGEKKEKVDVNLANGELLQFHFLGEKRDCQPKKKKKKGKKKKGFQV